MLWRKLPGVNIEEAALLEKSPRKPTVQWITYFHGIIHEPWRFCGHPRAAGGGCRRGPGVAQCGVAQCGFSPPTLSLRILNCCCYRLCAAVLFILTLAVLRSFDWLREILAKSHKF